MPMLDAAREADLIVTVTGNTESSEQNISGSSRTAACSPIRATSMWRS